MRSVLRHLAVFTALLTCFTSFSQESPAQESKKEPSGSVSGRVVLGDKPVPRAMIMLSPLNRSPLQRTPPARATTDEDGRYRLAGVPAGTYTVTPFTPAFVVPAETSFSQPGKSVTLGEGEEADDIDFALTRGGVITGRVTDADGRPLVDQRVNLMRVDEAGRRMQSIPFVNPYMFSTDDRGIYRIYGLAPGRYKVSVGDAPESGMIRIGFGGGVYSRTFHPGLADESRATIVEVRAGVETTEIDIKMSHAAKTYIATGRIVDADSGKPLPNLLYGHGALMRDQTNVAGFGFSNNRTNENGEFRIDGLQAGRYAAFVVSTEQVEFYSEPAVFEVAESDVSGLEVKVRRGSSITGVAVVEGSSDSEVLAKLSKMELRTLVLRSEVTAPSMAAANIGPDGSFRITGLRPGNVRIMLGGFPPPQKGFTLLRVERDGVEQPDGIEIGAGESVSDVRVVIGYGTGVVRGLVKFQGGEVAPETRFRVAARRIEGGGGSALPSAMVDARGRFTLEGLLPGDYELVLHPLLVPASTPGAVPPPGRASREPLAKQTITVTNGQETEVTLVVQQPR